MSADIPQGQLSPPVRIKQKMSAEKQLLSLPPTRRQPRLNNAQPTRAAGVSSLEKSRLLMYNKKNLCIIFGIKGVNGSWLASLTIMSPSDLMKW
jgi:hypothetical protein